MALALHQVICTIQSIHASMHGLTGWSLIPEHLYQWHSQECVLALIALKCYVSHDSSDLT